MINVLAEPARPVINCVRCSPIVSNNAFTSGESASIFLISATFWSPLSFLGYPFLKR